MLDCLPVSLWAKISYVAATSQQTQSPKHLRHFARMWVSILPYPYMDMARLFPLPHPLARGYEFVCAAYRRCSRRHHACPSVEADGGAARLCSHVAVCPGSSQAWRECGEGGGVGGKQARHSMQAGYRIPKTQLSLTHASEACGEDESLTGEDGPHGPHPFMGCKPFLREKRMEGGGGERV